MESTGKHQDDQAHREDRHPGSRRPVICDSLPISSSLLYSSSCFGFAPDFLNIKT